MTLTIGTRLGPYEIVSSLGAGGMGEVYRATDTKLKREVAVKILPSALSLDPDRLARFQREAEVLASLNHPNIAAVYGLEDAVSGKALVMELVEGQDLAQRVDGPLPLDEALPIARQIAEALEAAHEQGVIHRDLKPSNIKVRADGTVKVLDFGLAKALDTTAHSSADAMTSPAPLAPVTQDGLVLGTPAYMSPEQARGRAVDRRADVWAFGVVLYELLAGTRMFPGDTISDTLAAVLTKEPEWERLPAATPDAVRTLIRRCVDRDPRCRLQAIGEARIVLSDPGAGRRIATPTRGSLRRAALVGLVALVAAGLGFIGRSLIAGNAPEAAPVRKLDVALSGLQANIDSPPVISPDGQWVLYKASGQLWIRSLGDFTPRPVARSAGARYGFWSPDSREVAFVRDWKLWRTSVAADDATPVSTVPGDMTGSGAGAWTAGGQILLAGSNNVGLFGVSANGDGGREIVPLSRPDESDFHEVTALPGDRGVLLTVHGPAGADRIDVFANGRRKQLLHIPGENLRWPVYAAPGYLVYAREVMSRGIWAIRFSLERLETEGEPFPVLPNASSPSVSTDGTLAVVRGSDLPSEILSIDRKGSVHSLGPLQGHYWEANQEWGVLSLSPDGRRLALTMTEPGGSELWSYDLERGTMERLSLGGQVVVSPTWSADGSRVFFAAFAGHRSWNVFAVPSSETGRPQRVMPVSHGTEWPCTVSPDGRWLVYAQMLEGTVDLWVTSLDGTPGQPLMKTPAREIEAKFSPDGRWLAYTSDESGQNEVYLRAFPIDAHRSKVSMAGGAMPVWSADGQELFYRTATSLSSVRVTKAAAGRLQVSDPEQLFPITAGSGIANSYAVMPDGEHFVFARSTDADRLSIILNWSSQLTSGGRTPSP